jgi:hypothetical protein
MATCFSLFSCAFAPYLSFFFFFPFPFLSILRSHTFVADSVLTLHGANSGPVTSLVCVEQGGASLYYYPHACMGIQSEFCMFRNSDDLPAWFRGIRKTVQRRSHTQTHTHTQGKTAVAQSNCARLP